MLALHSPLQRGTRAERAASCSIGSGGDTDSLRFGAPRDQRRRPVGAAGGRAHRRLPAAALPDAHYAKGNYYALAGGRRSRGWFTRCPNRRASACTSRSTSAARRASARMWNGCPRTWAGQANRGLRVDPRRADGFYAEVRRYWPQLQDGMRSAPAYSGVRSRRSSGPDDPAADFLIGVAGPARALTVMTCRDTPDDESHDRPPLTCSAHSGLHAGIVRRAGSMLPEFPVSPPALLPQGEKGGS
jgi:hypothetical protein